jgi:hypothetical protein
MSQVYHERKQRMNIDKQIIVDLYEVIKSQNALISFLVATDQALMDTLANDAALSNFSQSFQRHHVYSAANPKGQVAETLAELQRMLAAVGEKLKRDTGGWNN